MKNQIYEFGDLNIFFSPLVTENLKSHFFVQKISF